MGADTRESRGYSSLSLTLLKPWEKTNNNNNNNKVEIRELGVFNKSAPTWRSAASGAWPSGRFRVRARRGRASVQPY